MKIAQVAPLHESVPPRLYGGTERVVYNLTEELVALGHDVTLYASGDSATSARLIPHSECALRLDPTCRDPLARHMTMLETVYRDHLHYDLIHSHVDYLPFSFARRCTTPFVTTLHGRLDLPDLVPLYDEYSELPVVSISDAQRRPLRQANWVGTVYHGLRPDRFVFRPEPGKYLAFLGRISPEKGVDTAIKIARQVGYPLRIAAKIDRVDWEYYCTAVKPLMDHPLIEYIGEIGENEKSEFLGHALALVFPIDWPEPFGLAMIEAMACGTPVVAARCGSIPEVVDHGITGYIFDTFAEAIDAIEHLPAFDRTACRETFEQRFTARRMATDYLDVYSGLVANRYRQGVVEPYG